MAGWLSRATEAFRKQPPPAPEPYEVGCDCGGRVIGERSRNAQRPPCPSCGRLIFVLPANVYPRSVNPAPKKAIPKPNTAKNPDAKETTSKAQARAKVVEDEVAARDERSGIALEAKEKRLTPFRLAMTAMLVVSSLTAWGLWNRHRVETAKAIVAKATEAGLQAWKDRDFDTAARELERARDAVDLLKRTDAESQSVRCLFREAIAARGLAQDSLFELLHSSMADLKPGDKDAKKFDGLYRHSWVLFDAAVLVPEDTTQPCTLDMPIFHRTLAIRIEANFGALRQAARQAPDGESPRVIFAAQLDRFTPPSGAQSEAVLTLKDQSAFLWTSFDNYTALGYHEEDAEELKATHAVLERQFEVMKEMK
ncbi:MAG: hypothetical protein AABP62_08695 [Planctomycetota bacterium]